MKSDFNKSHKRNSTGRGITVISILMLILIMFSQPLMAGTGPSTEVSSDIERAVLDKEWTTVTKKLESVEPGNSSPVLRAIKGHAGLALNRNNDALCLFLSISTEEELKEWDDWTEVFVRNKFNSEMTHYLKGDALARQKKWDRALEEFNKALEINPDDEMVLNARGVVYAAKGDWDASLIDLTKATMVNKDFADAYNSLGAMWIQRRTGGRGALKAFNQAIKLSPDFSLALNGRGSANFVLGYWNKAEEDYENIVATAECPLPVVIANMLEMDRVRSDFNESEEYAMIAGKNPGMSMNKIQRRIDGMSVEEGKALYNKINRDMSWNQKVMGFSKAMGGGSVDAGKYGSFGSNFNKLNNNSRDNLRHQSQVKDMLVNKFGQSNLSSGSSGMNFRDFNRPNPSGVTADMRQAYIDRGVWTVEAWSGLIYYVGAAGNTNSTEKGE